MRMDEDRLSDREFVEQGYVKLRDLFDMMQEGILNKQWYEVGKLCHGIGSSLGEMLHACTHLMSEDEWIRLQKEILEQVHGKPYVVIQTPVGRMLVQDDVQVPDDMSGLDGK